MRRTRINQGLAGLSLAVLIFLGESPVYGQATSAPPPSELDLLDRAIDNLLRENQPEQEPSSEYVRLLQQEIRDLKQTLTQVKDILDESQAELAALQEEYAAIRTENEALRENIRLRYGAGSALPNVPMPNRDLVESILRDHESADERAAPQQAAAPAQPKPASRPTGGAVEYRIAEEWGRSPEVAQQLSGNASSLKGMALIVPGDAGGEALTRTARQLYERYAAYDNLNIAAFADDAGAQSFADTGAIDEMAVRFRLVRHRSSGRDSLMLYEGGHAIAIDP